MTEDRDQPPLHTVDVVLCHRLNVAHALQARLDKNDQIFWFKWLDEVGVRP